MTVVVDGEVSADTAAVSTLRDALLLLLAPPTPSHAAFARMSSPNPTAATPMSARMPSSMNGDFLSALSMRAGRATSTGEMHTRGRAARLRHSRFAPYLVQRR